MRVGLNSAVERSVGWSVTYLTYLRNIGWIPTQFCTDFHVHHGMICNFGDSLTFVAPSSGQHSRMCLPQLADYQVWPLLACSLKFNFYYSWTALCVVLLDSCLPFCGPLECQSTAWQCCWHGCRLLVLLFTGTITWISLSELCLCTSMIPYFLKLL